MMALVEAEVIEHAASAYLTLIQAAEPDGLRDGTQETPRRAALAWRDLTGGYHVDVSRLFKTFAGAGYDEIVAMSQIPVYSLCEHHLLPFIGEAAVAYIPNGGGRIIGLSKIARVVDAYARRLQVQERLTQQVADAFTHYLEPRGVMVIVRARHLCMELRGVGVPRVPTTTSVVRGLFKDDPRARAEALTLLSQP